MFEFQQIQHNLNPEYAIFYLGQYFLCLKIKIKLIQIIIEGLKQFLYRKLRFKNKSRRKSGSFIEKKN